MADIIRPSFQKAITYQPDTRLIPAEPADPLSALEVSMARIERQNADLWLLAVAQKEIMLGRRMEFSEDNKRIMLKVVRASPFNGACPCCLSAPIVQPNGMKIPAVQYDHFYHAALGGLEHGWPICLRCHLDVHVTHLARLQRQDRFHRFRDAVLASKAAARSDA